jgi:hypothetical protein
MNGEGNLFYIVKGFVWYASPFIFLIGLLILLYGNYRRIEELLGTEVGGIQKKVIPSLEKNIYKFHEWLLEKRILTGILLIVCAALFYIFGKP